jgi:pilus assembly protein CpaF
MSAVDAVHQRLWADPEAAKEGRGLLGHIDSLMAEELPLTNRAVRDEAAAAVAARVMGLGALQVLAEDPDVVEIMVNAGSQVWVERRGRLERTEVQISAGETVELARRLAAAVGRRIDRSSPSVDVRLADGSRLHAVIPPLAVDGPCLTIRRFSDRSVSLHELAGSATDLLQDAVARSATIVASGATSSGKTTLLNALGAHLGDARVVTIEDAAELRLDAEHVVRLETRAAGEGVAAVGLRALVREALRMRPDRILCGEMRGAEALDLVQAMNTGHAGSMSTVHANGPVDALRRIETMMLQGDAELPLVAIREQLCSCIDLVVQMGRGAGALRYVTSVAEVPARWSGSWELTELFDGDRLTATPSRGWAS